jgi:hypothetical protein
MKPNRHIFLPLILALLWFGGGYTAMWGLSNIFPFLTPYIFECGLANVIIGLGILAFITKTEAGEQLFYYGPPQGEENGGGVAIIIAMLWAFPPVFFFMGLLWWILGFILRWFRV